MTDVVEHLLLEPLKKFQAGHDRIERKLAKLLQRVGQLELGLAGLRRDPAHADKNGAGISIRPDRVSERLDRMERRLEITG